VSTTRAGTEDEGDGEVPGVGVGQRAEGDRPDGRVAHQGFDLRAGLGPGRREDQQWPAGGEREQVTRELQGGRIGPVQVLQHDDRGPPGREQARDHHPQRREGGLPEISRPDLALPVRRPKAHDVLHGRQQVGAGQQRGERPFKGGPQDRTGLVRGHADPACQELLVQAIRGG
jgi:hypothetical protein